MLFQACTPHLYCDVSLVELPSLTEPGLAILSALVCVSSRWVGWRNRGCGWRGAPPAARPMSCRAAQCNIGELVEPSSPCTLTLQPRKQP
jgi:hypothetical protein